jgi:hypothetical protein
MAACGAVGRGFESLWARYKKSLRRYDAIAADESLSAAERMDTERCGADIVIALVKIEIEGPRIVHDTFRKFNGKLQEKT